MDLTKSQLASVARSLEMDPALVPHAAFLLQDLDELGSDSDQIVDICRGLNLPTGFRVLDLGCGKGDACWELSSKLGAQCIGVDLNPDFIQHAKQESNDLDIQCIQADISQPLDFGAQFDVVMALAVGDVLGNTAQTLYVARRYCVPGGHIIVSDGYLIDKRAPMASGFETYRDRATTVKMLEQHGDKILAEHKFPDEDVGQDETSLIEKRAAELAMRKPTLALKLAEYIQDQNYIVEWMDDYFVDCTWVVRKEG